MLYDGDIIEHDGARFRVEFPFDDSGRAPWEDDGHGEVSDWKRHAFGQGSKPPKRPGELILCWDHGSYRTYDFKGACEIARRGGWGWLPGTLQTSEPVPGTWQAKAGNFTAITTASPCAPLFTLSKSRKPGARQALHRPTSTPNGLPD